MLLLTREKVKRHRFQYSLRQHVLQNDHSRAFAQALVILEDMLASLMACCTRMQGEVSDEHCAARIHACVISVVVILSEVTKSGAASGDLTLHPRDGEYYFIRTPLNMRPLRAIWSIKRPDLLSTFVQRLLRGESTCERSDTFPMRPFPFGPFFAMSLLLYRCCKRQGSFC